MSLTVNFSDEQYTEIATAIHYPEHWDTAVYPTLEAAMWEILTTYQCSLCEFDHLYRST